MNDSTRTHRWPWIVGIVLLAASAIGATWALRNNGIARSPAVEETAVRPPNVVSLGFVDVDPGVAQLHPLQQGRIDWVATEGAVVKKGDPILKLDSRLAEAKVEQAQAALDDARKQLENAKNLPEQQKLKVQQQEKAIAAAKARRKQTAAEYGVRKDFAAKSVLDAYQSGLEALDAMAVIEELKLKELQLVDPELDMARAQIDVDAKQAQFRQAQIGLEETVLKAPTDGLILRVMVQAGEVLGPSPKFAAVQFAPKGMRIVRAEVLQEWAPRVQVGQDVLIEDDTYNGKKWEGKVVRLSHFFAQKRSPIIEPFMFNDVRTLECIIEITSPSDDLRIGQRVRAHIKTPS